METWIAIAVFSASVLDDLLYVFFVRRVMRGSMLSAALLSGLMTALVSWEGYWQYANNWKYAFFNSIGSVVGCPLAMFIDDKLPKPKQQRDKKGKFKPSPTIQPPEDIV